MAIANRKESIFISQTAIKKWGNSQGIRLSKEIISSAGLKENDSVEISVNNGVITIKKVKPKYLTFERKGLKHFTTNRLMIFM